MSFRCSLLRKSRARLASERGSILVEVLIGTLLLALTSAAVLNGMDGAQKTGRQNKDRSASATLAQQDLERLRALPPTVLSNLSETRTVTLAGVNYTVTSRTDWVRDASGLVSCTTDDTNAEYLKLSSTVYSPASVARPVTATSLLTPPPGSLGDNTGTAAVKLTDRDGNPLANVDVTLDGPSSLSGQTNELGCAIFGFIAADDWVAKVDDGLITWTGEAPAESPVTVAADKTSLTQIELDEPASLRASFVTPAGVAAQWSSISVANAKLPNGYKPFPVGAVASSKDATNLFPFQDGYGVYAGKCEANNPAVWDGDYFQTSGYGFAALDPGDLLKPVQVVLPQLHVTLRRTSNGTSFSSYTDARIYVQQVDSDFDCTAVIANLTAATGTYGTPPSAPFATFNVPLPFGNYEVCAAVKSGSNWRRKLTGTSGMPANPSFTGATLDKSITMDLPTSGGGSGTSNQCTAVPS